MQPVLIVDDDDYIREMLALLLRTRGYAVQAARHGQEALELLRAAARLPRVIFLDLSMPVLDGWQTLAALRASERLSNLPVVVMSAVGAAAIPSGIDGYLPKPFAVDALLAWVARFCEEPGARPPAATRGEEPVSLDRSRA